MITGGTSGLGLAAATAFAAADAAVVVASRRAESVAAAVGALRRAGARAEGVVCDVGDLTQVEALAQRAVEAFGGFHVWVNNAAVPGPYGPTTAVDVSVLERVWRTNILGTCHGSVIALRHFLSCGQGKLVNVLGRGARHPAPQQNAYGSSKAWIRHFTRALAAEHRHRGVGIHLFSPGLMDTPMVRQVEAVAGTERELAVFATILRMWAKPPEVVARRLLWLVSPATDGRSGLEVSASGSLHLFVGACREGLRRLLGRTAPPVEVTIRWLPPAGTPSQSDATGHPGSAHRSPP